MQNLPFEGATLLTYHSATIFGSESWYGVLCMCKQHLGSAH